MTEKKIEDIIRMRYSCRSYRGDFLTEKDRSELGEFISQKITGPFGSSARFTLFAAEASDSTALKGLGTYGFIKNPAAFIAGIVKEPEMNLEDFGYSMERIILHATEMGLGSCWLGGTFKKSGFAQKAGIGTDEMIPAIAAIGYIAERRSIKDRLMGSNAGAANRKDADEIFFSSGKKKINIDPQSPYGRVLEMVRLAPSASNKQPWRIVKEDGKNIFHFFLERTSSYSLTIRLLKLADMQRIDMGIAMCHFESVAIESGLMGFWVVKNPVDIKTPSDWEYSITWEGK